jgi:SAM-dependent methyltransferase
MAVKIDFQRGSLHSKQRRALISALPLLALSRFAQAQEPPQPVFGTPGKDAGWIPTPEGMVESMLKLAGTTPADVVADLGSGDGRIPILAAKTFGSRGLGIELNGDLVRFSQREAEKEGVADRVRFVQGDIFETDFSSATVITLFMPPVVLKRLRPQLLKMKPGTRVLSYLFAMDDWDPDAWTHIEGTHGMLWIVPGNAGGTWRFDVRSPEGAPLAVRIEQRVQKIDGRFLLGDASLPLFDTRLEGDRLKFTALAGDRRFDFKGTLRGDRLEGELHVTGQPLRPFVGVRSV